MTQKQTAPQGGEAAALPANCYHATSTTSLATFTAWVEAQKAQALEGMKPNTDSDAFGKSCDWFIELLVVTRALEKFEDVVIEAAKKGGAA